jgi:hypothetical protein
VAYQLDEAPPDFASDMRLGECYLGEGPGATTDERRNIMLGDLWKESRLAGALEDRWREEAMGEMLQVVLESRFGPLSDDIVAALRRTDEATLRAIGAHIMSETLEQVRSRLGLD